MFCISLELKSLNFIDLTNVSGGCSCSFVMVNTLHYSGFKTGIAIIHLHGFWLSAIG
jgi:hypothetical protein